MKNFIFVIIFAWSCLLAMTHAQCTFYTLKSGQTFASLSNGNSALFNLLVANNPPVNGNYAYAPGSTICIPSAYYSSFNFGTSSNTASCTFYTIRSGDSFYLLSNGNSALISALVNIKGLNLWLLKPDYFLNLQKGTRIYPSTVSVPYRSVVFRPFWSTAQRTVLF
jgi:hypothetical protein